MDDAKRAYRDAEDKTKTAGRELDGHQVSDDIGNAGDEVREGLGNAGDEVREHVDYAGDSMRTGLGKAGDEVREHVDYAGDEVSGPAKCTCNVHPGR